MSEAANNKNKLLIMVVFIVFLSPVILSWLVFNYTDAIKIRGTSNNGELILPPRPIGNLRLIDPLQAERRETLHGKWSMVYIAKACDAMCIENVYRMRQIHVAMDKHSLRVQKVLFLTHQGANELTVLLADYAGQQVIHTEVIDGNALLDKFRLTQSDKPLEAGHTYIVDPLGNLIMWFHSDADPRDIIGDLKKLLRASRIG